MPPTLSWGSIHNGGSKTTLTTPHELIALAFLAFMLLGDGLQDALEARVRATERAPIAVVERGGRGRALH